MNPLKTIIIDDSKAILETMSLMLNDYFNDDIEIIATYSSPEHGLKGIIDLEPDLVFLDVEMPEMDGILLTTLLPQHSKSKVIIISGNEKYALDAIKHAVFDYIVKPISLLELKRTIDKFKIYKQNSSVNQHDISDNLLIVNRQDKAVFIDLNAVIKIEANGACSEIFYENKKIGSTKSFKHYENILPAQLFVKVHRSCILNLNYIQEVIKQDGVGYLILKDGSKLELSKTKKDELMKRLMGFIKN